jgi:hypothetical protein
MAQPFLCFESEGATGLLTDLSLDLFPAWKAAERKGLQARNLGQKIHLVKSTQAHERRDKRGIHHPDIGVLPMLEQSGYLFARRYSASAPDDRIALLGRFEPDEDGFGGRVGQGTSSA